MSQKLKPKCMDREYVSQHYSLSKHKPKTFPKGKADSGAELIKGIAYSSLGWLIPCCWVDPRLKKDFVDDGNIITDRKYDIRKYPKYADLFTEELKLKNVEKVEDILYSKAWNDFADALLNHPNECPPECHTHCGVEEDETKMSEDVLNELGKHTKDHLVKGKINRETRKFHNYNSKHGYVAHGHLGFWLEEQVDSLILKMKEDGMSDKYIEMKVNLDLMKRHYTDEEWNIFWRYKRMSGKKHE